jgi:hypothetical protein
MTKKNGRLQGALLALCSALAFSFALASCAGYRWLPSPRPVPAANQAEAALLGYDRFNGVCGLDLSAMDLSKVSINVLSEIVFNTETLWPPRERMPEGFDPQAFLESRAYQPFGMDALRSRGVTGAGVAVAVIDKPIDGDHPEFSGRMRYIEVAGAATPNGRHFHGISCASIIGGRTCGLAPEACLYYFAVPDNGRNQENYLAAMDMLLELNRSLPDGGKIRIVSISDTIMHSPATGKLRLAIDAAEKEGIDVNYADYLNKRTIAFGGLEPSKDRDDPDSYVLSRMLRRTGSLTSALYLPSDRRATADNSGGYRYWPMGGFSWAIAYVTGLSALAYQVDPEIRLPEIVELLFETKRVNDAGLGVVDPQRFIEAVRRQKI